MFGPIMQFRAGEVSVRLSPLKREDMASFVEDGGMQRYSVTRYLGHPTCPAVEDEYEWFDKVRADKDVIVWGIFVRQSDSWQLIGNTALHQLNSELYRGAASGCLVFRPEWWNRGIISHAHRARTMYAFDQLNLTVIRSCVFQANPGSAKALTKVGYVPVSTERNVGFVDGQWQHMRNYELVNPDPLHWRLWWHGDTPSKAFRQARQRTATALEWARQHVELL